MSHESFAKRARRKAVLRVVQAVSYGCDRHIAILDAAIRVCTHEDLRAYLRAQRATVFALAAAEVPRELWEAR